jgi:hypothetical protein
MTSGPVLPQARTYGGWRRPASPGLGSLTLLPTVGVFAGLMISIVALATGGMVAGVATVVVCGVALLPLVVKRADRPAWREIALRWAWWRATSTRSCLYRSGLAGTTEDDGYRLPGLLARTRVWPAQDSGANPFALIEHPGTNQWTVVLAVNPTGGALISSTDRDVRIAQWDRWLAGLGREPGIDQVAVVLDQVPDSGRILQACVSDMIAPGCPPFAEQMMREAAEVYPTGGAQISAYVSLTFSGRQLQVPAGGARDLQAAELAAVEIGTRVPGLARTLAVTGTGEGRPLTVSQLAAQVRAWYDPAVALALAEAEALAQDPGITWDEAGPVAAQETWDTYRHDSGLSRVYELTLPPRGSVFDTVLLPLVSPLPGVERKRVTILYRPLDAAEAPNMLDLQIRAARNRAARRSGLVHAHDSVEVRAAMQAAQEEATGAGVTNFSMFVTVTVDGDGEDPAEELRRVSETVTRAGRAAQLRLRPVTGAQAVAFATGLGVGLAPANHSLLPAVLRANA